VEQLATLDAGFLEAEDSDRQVSLAIGGLAVIDVPAPDCDALVATLAERVPSIPRFTQVLRMHLLDVGAPQWVNDDRSDIAHHVHRRALPQPGDDAALFRLVAEIMECPPGNVVPGRCDSLHVDRTAIAGAASRAVGPLPATSALSTQRATVRAESGEIVDCGCSAISVTVGARRSTSSNSRSARLSQHVIVDQHRKSFRRRKIREYRRSLATASRRSTR